MVGASANPSAHLDRYHHRLLRLLLDAA